MIRVRKIADIEGLECELLAKCEFYNSGGSVKDRIGKRMIEDAEKSGRIKPGDTLIEPTSGNTGVGLAMTAVVKGYRMVITLPEKMSNEKMDLLKGLGAEIIRTPTEAAWDAPESHIGVAARLVKELPRSHILDQYANPANPMAHYEGTAEEILWQCDNRIDMIVCGAGTGGTITGIAKKIKERLPDCKIVGVDPHGSILAQPEALNKDSESYQIEGIGYDFVPNVLDRSLIDEWIKVGDHDALKMARRIIKSEGMLCGGSSGSAMCGALKAAKSLKKGQRCVVLLPDSVRNYMSKFLSDGWMVDNKFEKTEILTSTGGLLAGTQEIEWWQKKNILDLNLTTPMTVPPTMESSRAVDIMKEHGFDQLPVVCERDGVLGVVTLGTLSSKILSKRTNPKDPVSKNVFASCRQVPLNTPLSELHQFFQRDAFCLVVADQRGFTSDTGAATTKTIVVAVCSRIDLLDYVVKHGED